MKNIAALFVLLFSQIATADVFWFVRQEDGNTNWQYVANFSSGILIVALSITAIRLAFTRRAARRYNRDLEEIRAQLENRVKERTATLDNANSLLQQSNSALEAEVTEHRDTTTKLRLSESYITSILRSMPLMLIGLNKNGEITQWNNRAEEISTLASDKVLGKNLWQAYPTIAVTPEQIKQAQDEDKTLTVKYSQRGQYHYDITIYPLHDQLETGVVIMVDDVTQRVQSENMLVQRDKMSSMGEMASVMAQDINKPLTAIIKDIKTVRQSVVDDNLDTDGLSDLLEETIIRGQQASSVITNLLNFSAGGGGEKTKSNVCKVMNGSLDLANDVLSVTDNLRFSQVQVDKQYADNLPDISCHTTELQQAFLSLFRHACHALDEIDYKPKIGISIDMSFDDIWVRIQHNGQTIELEDQKTLFEPFNQENALSKEVATGTHLSFAHFIITEQHQGQIAVTSNKEDGTTFHIQLPTQ